EYGYGKGTHPFDDLGAPLGKALRHLINTGAFAWPLAPARECIRATVMGAAQHTIQVSGNTIYRSSDALLPRKNLQVLRPPVDLTDSIDSTALGQAMGVISRLLI